jgi:hypothetical protein
MVNNMWLDTLSDILPNGEAATLLTVSIRLALTAMPLLAQQAPAPAPGVPGDDIGFDNSTSTSPIEESLRQAGQEAAKIGEAWDQHWLYALNGPIYIAMSYAGTVCAVMTLLFFMMQWAKDWNEGNITRPLGELIWPLLVAILLTPAPLNIGLNVFNGSVSYGWNGLAKVTQQVRFLFNRAEVLILNAPGFLPVELNLPDGTSSIQSPNTNFSLNGSSVSVSAPTIRSAFQDANAITSAQAMIQSYVNKCFSYAGQQQQECFNNSINASVQLLDTYQRVYGREIKWMIDRAEELEKVQRGLAGKYGSNQEQSASAADAEQPQPTASNVQLTAIDFPAWMVGDPKADIRQLLQGGAMGFRQMLEIAFLGTALVAPIALGCSLLPVPAASKTITTWFAGFCAIGFTKITYAIIVGIASSVMIQAAPVDTTWFYTFLTFLAPLIATGLATGGGLALNSALSQAASPLVR